MIFVNERSESITPKGDGNRSLISMPRQYSALFRIHYPERGRKPFQSTACQAALLQAFRIHYPERGRKLCHALSISKGFWFRIHYPERGRKPKWGRLKLTLVITGFRIHYPERGRKRVPTFPLFLFRLCSESITPKGDGNLITILQHLLYLEGSESITPKGDGNT